MLSRAPSTRNIHAGRCIRFHPEETEIVDLTSTADQMKIIDTLETAQIKVSVIDVRAGGLSIALQALQTWVSSTR